MSVFVICLIGAGCSTSNEPTNNTNVFNGFIYYSNGTKVYRMQMSTQTTTELFSNARHPEITASGEILCVETYPVTRLIFSDLTAANRQTLVESESYTGPAYKEFISKPRISYNQKYVVYEGDAIHNPNTYVVDATDGTLIRTIGDYDASQPMISPSWAPDGSVFVQGWTSMNNGIYKVSADFLSMARIDPNLTNVSEPAVSPDGKTIAFIRDQKLWTMGIDGTNPIQLNTTATKLHSPVWSPDSKYIAVVSLGHIHIIDPKLLTDTEITKSHYVDTGNQLSWAY